MQILGACICMAISLALAFYPTYLWYKASNLQRAKAFRDFPKLWIQATVEESGIEYDGLCHPPGHYHYSSCSLDAECTPLQKEYYPSLSTGDPHRQADEERKESSRRLRPHSNSGHGSDCNKEYREWFRVSFKHGIRTIRRCAFEYGTHANTPPHNDHSLLKNELDAHPVGQTLEVWAVKSQGTRQKFRKSLLAFVGMYRGFCAFI